MPRVIAALADRQIRAAECAQFACRRAWRRSAKGNLWREYDGLNLTIFRRDDGSYSWCIASDDDGPHYSTARYESEDEAIDSLSCKLVF